MGGIDLGSVKAKLEVDASGIDRSIEQAIAALQALRSSSEQTAKYLEVLMQVPAANRDAFMAPLLAAAGATEQWTDAQQRAAMAMSRMHDEALKMNKAFDQGLNPTLEKSRGFFDGFVASLKSGLGFGAAFEVGRRAADLLLSSIRNLAEGTVELVKRGSEVEKIS